ncbi:MAG: ABC transporter permease, partial [Acidobacteriaceae bacterium]
KTNILGMVLGETLTLLAIGVVAGAGLAVAAGNVARVMLFGLQPADPAVLVLAAGSLTLIALVASVLPAARAAGVDPMQVLREE